MSLRGSQWLLRDVRPAPHALQGGVEALELLLELGGAQRTTKLLGAVHPVELAHDSLHLRGTRSARRKDARDNKPCLLHERPQGLQLLVGNVVAWRLF